ncbi:hypothetical protein PSECIP111951_01360 [Pseudoalteromonas holothuriae]|uniref:Tail specific protease domain-containing protein n=1 Tax=Pseudoalteromonas holothuriae TaxID=2963714 RepID=A0ABM9GH32_9GAMM|nr:S41 family peptidase [Pseudoalteromonas sp. CIP111951]CAH9055975.1 hypothetical protein PSECIP111951_01360 [Pseudoalteromonas sp. CIP111951]
MKSYYYILILTLFWAHKGLCNGADKSNQHFEMLTQLQQSIQLHYVEVQNIPSIINALDTLAQSKSFKSATSSKQLLSIINNELHKFDKHLSMSFVPSSNKKSTTDETIYESWFDKLARKNYGFERVEVLPGNVGLLSFWGFANVTKQSKRKVAAIITLLEDSDSLIIDLRNNGGGDATMVQLISSYFLEKDTHLNSFYSRDSGLTSEFWTVPVNGKKRPKLPIYILTSNKTFSAAEEFAYNFKHLGRATIIGENTKGGANPWRFVNLPNGIRVAMPTSKAINPITKTNWEGVGVKPDIKVKANQALEASYTIALEQLREKAKNKLKLQDIMQALENTSSID